MKLCLIIILLAFLTSCGSATKKTDVSSALNSESQSFSGTPMKPSSLGEIQENEAVLNAANKSQDIGSVKNAADTLLLKDPNNQMGMNSSALIYLNKKQPEAAQYILKKAVGLYPKSDTLLVSLGLSHMAKAENTEAISSFERALEVNPDNSAAICNLSYFYLEGRDVTRLQSLFKGKFDFKTVSNGCAVNYGLSMAASGKLDEAVQAYEFVLAKNNEQQETLYNYSVLSIERSKNYQKGLDLIKKIKLSELSEESAQLIKNLESKAKTALK